ncbi:hypothetical protein AB205_0216830, partial [Aquarana catesbeiana]
MFWLIMGLSAFVTSHSSFEHFAIHSYGTNFIAKMTIFREPFGETFHKVIAHQLNDIDSRFTLVIAHQLNDIEHFAIHSYGTNFAAKTTIFREPFDETFHKVIAHQSGTICTFWYTTCLCSVKTVGG